VDPGDAEPESEPDKKSRRRLQAPAILVGLISSLAVANPVVAIAIFALACGGYAACKRPGWLRAQRCLAWFIGGFSAGAGIVLLAIFDRRHRAAIGWACLVSVCVAATAAFRLLERRFSLVPRVPSPPAPRRPRVPALAIAERRTLQIAIEDILRLEALRLVERDGRWRLPLSC
jgi:hypothetical protein